MTSLSEIHGIGRTSIELLEAAGFLDAEALAKAGVDELVLELERANRILQIAKRAPARKNIEKWIASARGQLNMPEPPASDASEQDVPVSAAVPEPTMPVNFEATAQVQELLMEAPLAIPLPARLLMENHLAVSDIPPGILLNRYSGDLEVRIADRTQTRPAPTKAAPQTTAWAIPRAPQRNTTSSYVKLGDSGPQRLEIDVSRVRSTGDPERAPSHVPVARVTLPMETAADNERLALIRGPLPETNRGRNPHSRFYVRGVLHTHPVSMTVGAFVTLVTAIMLPLGVIAASLLLLSDIFPGTLPWVNAWWLVLPCSLPVLGLLYLIFGVGGKCRICTQRQFVPRGCRKNTKAHHITGLGHIIPVCIHILLFRWFRCTYCGTPVRLKK